MLNIRTNCVAIGAVVLATLSAGIAAADCTCRAAGRDYELGTSVCLRTPSGFRLATCGMVLNNTSWQFSSSPCVDAQRREDAGGEATSGTHTHHPAHTGHHASGG